MGLEKIIKEIKAERPEITSVIFVGCGASQAKLYPVEYFLGGNAKKLRTSLYTTDEFVCATPAYVGKESIIITCSPGGNVPETVGASRKAMNMDAKVIAITHTLGSPLVNNAHYVVLHGFEKNYVAKLEKMTLCLQLAAEILNQYGGYGHYQDIMTGLGKISDLIEDAVSFAVPFAKRFAENYKDTSVTYIMSPGATHTVAYPFFIRLLMEVQWTNPGSSHDGEFFCGLFEIIDKDVPLLLLTNGGSTRALDPRALDFLDRFQAKATLIDTEDFGLESAVPVTVKDYFNSVLIIAVLRVYTEQLIVLRNHLPTWRRYMWKLEY